jgi:superfamily II DNA or RNA helicase
MAVATEWQMPNRQGFLSWAYETYHPDKYAQKEAEKGYGLMPQQKFTKEFIHIDNPYRGLLLYHGLGVGKTCTSIAASEGFINRHKKVIVMVPASLATNYKEEIMKCGSIGNPKKKVWSLIDISKLSTVNKKIVCNKLYINQTFAKGFKYKIWIPYLNQADAKADGIEILKKDIKWDSISDDEREDATKCLENIIEQKYTIINYNGLNSKNIATFTPEFFSDSFIIIDEAHNFISRVVNNSEITKKIYKNIMMAVQVKILLLTGTPVINHPFELAISLNLVKGPILEYELSIDKGIKPETVESILKAKGVIKLIDYLDIKETGELKMTLVPDRFILNDSYKLVKNTNAKLKGNYLKLVMSALKEVGVVAKYKTNIHLALPNKKEDFENLFLDNSNPDNPITKNQDLFIRRILGTVSYFKSAGEQYFPSVSMKHIKEVFMSQYQFSKYLLERDKERKMEDVKRRMNRGKSGGLLGTNGSVYRAFSRMTCNFVFPEKIKRPFPKDLRNVSSEIDAIKEDIELETETEADVDASVRVKGAVDKTLQQRYQLATAKAMKELNKKRDEYLNIQQLEGNYSPKMAKIIESIQKSPKTLLYSQFRTIEGLGVMEIILEEAGWKRVTLPDFDPEVFDPKYDNKRFIIFDNDRDKMKMLLQLYNGNFEKLPSEIQDSITAASNSAASNSAASNSAASNSAASNSAQKKERFKNLRGDLVNLIMITQSGAEGISLKTVRKVIIMEPFWNMVRMDQVIGRAVRTYSHESLPENERHVDVEIYTSIFTEDQLRKEFTLKTLDDGLSSDSHILRIAERKDNLIQTFLNYLKVASVDCRTHAHLNKPTKQGLQCYSFPISLHDSENSMANGMFAYVPDINSDSVSNIKLQRDKKIRGKVVMYKNDKYVIIDDNRKNLYDYNAYKEAGTLELVHKI